MNFALAFPFRKRILESDRLDYNRGSLPAYMRHSDVEGDLRGKWPQPANIRYTEKKSWPKIYHHHFSE